ADRVTDIGRRGRLADCVHELRRAVLAALDYEAEAGNLERFGEDLGGDPEPLVPAPVRDLTAKSALAMELVPGTKVTEISGPRRTRPGVRRRAGAPTPATSPSSAARPPTRARASRWRPRTARWPGAPAAGRAPRRPRRARCR